MNLVHLLQTRVQTEVLHALLLTVAAAVVIGNTWLTELGKNNTKNITIKLLGASIMLYS